MIPAHAQTNRLEHLEGIIIRGTMSFVDMGQALQEIRDKKLYQFHCADFDTYCKTRLGFGRDMANKLVRAYDTWMELETIVGGLDDGDPARDVEIINEGQARVVHQIQRNAGWDAVVDTLRKVAPTRVHTAESIKAVAMEAGHLPKPKKSTRTKLSDYRSTLVALEQATSKLEVGMIPIRDLVEARELVAWIADSIEAIIAHQEDAESEAVA